jgi:hypothetical protein
MAEPAAPSGPLSSAVAAGQASAPSAAPTPDAAPKPAEPSAAAPPPGAAAAGAAADRRVHVYEAAAHQRERVMSSFDAQRAAILKAVADQRMAALAPIMSVQAKMATSNAAAGTGAGPEARPAVGLAGASALGSGGRLPGFTPQQLVAADIVVAFKTMISDEVRTQLNARLQSATLGAAQPQSARERDPGADAASGAVSPAIGAALKATLKVMVAAEVAAQLDAFVRAAGDS